MYGLTQYHLQPHREAEEQAKKTNIDEGSYSVLSCPQSILSSPANYNHCVVHTFITKDKNQQNLKKSHHYSGHLSSHIGVNSKKTKKCEEGYHQSSVPTELHDLQNSSDSGSKYLR